VELYLDTITMETSTRNTLQKYLSLVSKRASGEYVTPATWIRKFVAAHPDYKQDSIITHKINHDLLNACYEISSGVLEVPELLPPLEARRLD
jgi:glutamate--cysteine ligase catalytic subunit